MLDRSRSHEMRDTTGGMLQTPSDRDFPLNPKIAALAAKIQILEAELEAELAQRRAELSVGLEKAGLSLKRRSYAAIAS